MVVVWDSWQLLGYSVVVTSVVLRGTSHVAMPLVVGEGWRFLRYPS